MAITFNAAGALATNITTTTLPVVAPALSADDIMIACLMNKSPTANTISPPDGSWAQVIQETNPGTISGHQYAVFWKRATGGDSGATFNFTKATDDNVLFTGVIGAWTGALAAGDVLDATASGATETTSNSADVAFPAFDPTATDVHVIFVAFYGVDETTFNAAMSSDTNPDCTTRWDLETPSGTDATIACTSGNNDGSNIAARTWSHTGVGTGKHTGVVFAIVPAAVGGGTTWPGWYGRAGWF